MPEDVEIIQLRNEHHQENGEIITDSCLRIGRKLYHIECQSVDDTTMAIRMIEYDFAIALDSARKVRTQIPDGVSKVLRVIFTKREKYA